MGKGIPFFFLFLLLLSGCSGNDWTLAALFVELVPDSHSFPGGRIAALKLVGVEFSTGLEKICSKFYFSNNHS